MSSPKHTPPWFKETTDAAARLFSLNPACISLLTRVAKLDGITPEQETLLEEMQKHSQNGIRTDIETILSYNKYQRHMKEVLRIGKDCLEQGKREKQCKDELLAYLGPFQQEKAPVFAILFDMLSRIEPKTNIWRMSVFPLLVLYTMAKQDPIAAASYRHLRTKFKETFPQYGFRGSSERVPIQAPAIPPLPPLPRPIADEGHLKIDEDRAAEGDFASEVDW